MWEAKPEEQEENEAVFKVSDTSLTDSQQQNFIFRTKYCEVEPVSSAAVDGAFEQRRPLEPNRGAEEMEDSHTVGPLALYGTVHTTHTQYAGQNDWHRRISST